MASMARQRTGHPGHLALGLLGVSALVWWLQGSVSAAPFVGPRHPAPGVGVGKRSSKVRRHDLPSRGNGAAPAVAAPQPPAAKSSKPRVPPVPMPFGDVNVDMTMMRFSHFVPRLYNFCRDLGMTKGRIMPSIGFCADENQGFPAITITKHFGAYPFTHGYIGGVMALDRHGPHAHHGDDFVIIHAPHVGYDPETETYGVYRRRQVADPEHSMSTCCGKVAGTLAPYIDSYEKALGRISVREAKDGVVLVNIGNSLLSEEDDLGIALNFDRLLEPDALENPLLLQSTSVVYIASAEFSGLYHATKTTPKTSKGEGQKAQTLWELDERLAWRPLTDPSLKQLLSQEFFSFKKKPEDLPGEAGRFERTLLPHLPFIITSPYAPDFTAALVIMQYEFDRGVQSIVTSPAYKDRNCMLISGLNIDVAPAANDLEAFPQTMFLPWAAYVQLADGTQRVIEQDALVTLLHKQPLENKDAIELERGFAALATHQMKRMVFHNSREGKLDEVRVV
ncbi:Uncharacterized protein SCF082_LOCUS50093 [Durusdinium trenchii]|uniref:Limiting CO2-inducible protein B/C beta carbonyic anhydrase domain-containing protein n=1 Tax=Durusdinium trenchii TaxID=1381693 RepID=A0ABP0S5L7_9DINO